MALPCGLAERVHHDHQPEDRRDAPADQDRSEGQQADEAVEPPISNPLNVEWSWLIGRQQILRTQRYRGAEDSLQEAVIASIASGRQHGRQSDRKT